MSIAIANRTDYRSADVRRLLAGAIKAEGERIAHRAWNLVITHAQTKDWNRAHAAVIPSTKGIHLLCRVVVSLPRPCSPAPSANVVALAMKLCFGIGGYGGEWFAADGRWARDLVIEPMPKAPPKTPAERAAERERHARKMCTRAETDRDRAQARVDKWAVKVRYYAKKQARTP